LLPRKVRFAADSLLEQKGFELAVRREVAVRFATLVCSVEHHSVSKIQPAGIKQLASSVHISTMRSSAMVICRFDRVWTAPIPGGA
jgi:hypothetical protein